MNERDWLERLVEEILGSVPTALSVVLSGSWAKRKAKSESDVDLLLIVRPNHKSRGPEVHERIDETRGKMTGRFGRPVSLLVLGREEFRRRLRKRDALVREIVGQGWCSPVQSSPSWWVVDRHRPSKPPAVPVWLVDRAANL